MYNNYKLQVTSIWNFPDRGSWLTHKGDYRGNWSPHIPKNLILKYTLPQDLVLDTFAGSGTTLIECKSLSRNSIGIDININALEICKERLNFVINNNTTHQLIHGDATRLDSIKDNSIDFICTHPPYADIIHYSENLNNDISLLNYQLFLEKINQVAKEHYRVLKNNKYCSFMIGDIRKNGCVVPLGFLTMQKYINAGFILKEIIIKVQNNCTSSSYWQNKSKQLNFYLLAHEYIFIFKK